jgi:hypothetical protein
MKVNCASTIQINSSKPYSPADTIKYVRAIVGKKAAVEVADAAKGLDLVSAARAAFAVDPSITITAVALVVNDVELDQSKTLAALGIKDGSSAQVRYVVTI